MAMCLVYCHKSSRIINICNVPNRTLSSVGGKYDNRCNSGLQGSVEVGKAFNVQHVNFVNEEHARHKFSYSLVDILVNNFVDLLSQFV